MTSRLSGEADEVRDIGSRLELFVDDYLIESIEGVALQLHRPVPREVVLQFNRPWEGNNSFFVSVFRDRDVYRMYYRASRMSGGEFQAGPRHTFTCYVESTDGITWHRPDLGLVDFEGSRQNNIVLLPPSRLDEGRPVDYGGSGLVDDFYAFKDENPQAPDSQRYKAVCNANWRTWGGGIWGFVSSDGVRWERVQETPVLLDGKGYDGPQGPAFWDPHRGEYHAYLRAWDAGGGEELAKLGGGPRVAKTPQEKDLLVKGGYDVVEDYQDQGGRVDPFSRHPAWRTVRHCTSDDFIHWTRPTLVQFDSPLSMDEQLYTNGVQPYFRAPHIYIGLPKRFAPFRHKVMEYLTGVSDGGFMTSRDGVHWKLWREAFIRPSLDRKTWVNRNNGPAWGMLETAPGEISVYWVEGYISEECELRRGTVRTDGFVSVNAAYAGGELLTRPLTFEGRDLVINYSTSAFGSVQVEVQDEAGSPLDGYSLAQCPVIYGDAIEHTVSWEGGSDVSALAEGPVRLRFVLKDADLYSIRFR